MDSLVTSAIALAAGGWDKVKLVGIYTRTASSIPAWKLGIYSPNIPATLSANTAALTWCSAVLVAYESKVEFVHGGNGFYVEFSVGAITCSTNTNIRGTAVLFTW